MMQQTSNSPVAIVGAQKSSVTQARLYGWQLVLARSIWAVLVLCALMLLVFNLPHLPSLLAQIQAPCPDAQCTTGFLSPDALRSLHMLGVSARTFAIFYIVIYALIPLVAWVAAGLFLVWRRSDDWMALLVSLFLILFQVSAILAGFLSTNLSSDTISTQTAPVWFVLFYYFGQSLAFPVMALFPNGRFVPRWMLWTTIAFIVADFTNGFVPSTSPLELVVFLLLLAAFTCLVGAIIYRYLRGATLLERQQIKWLAFGITLDLILNWIGPLVLPLLFPQAFAPHALLNVLYQLIWPLTILIIPISIGIAILRYHLWDIDTIINRTLVYGLLSGLLVALYIGLIIGLESLVGAMASGGQPVQPFIIVISTLVVAALFQPLRKRLQTLIDRRFYRKKYDVEKTLAAFQVILHNEVDLSTLCDHLQATMQEAMQPMHVSIWLCQREVSTEALAQHQKPHRSVSGRSGKDEVSASLDKSDAGYGQ